MVSPCSPRGSDTLLLTMFSDDLSSSAGNTPVTSLLTSPADEPSPSLEFSVGFVESNESWASFQPCYITQESPSISSLNGSCSSVQSPIEASFEAPSVFHPVNALNVFVSPPAPPLPLRILSIEQQLEEWRLRIERERLFFKQEIQNSLSQANGPVEIQRLQSCESLLNAVFSSPPVTSNKRKENSSAVSSTLFKKDPSPVPVRSTMIQKEENSRKVAQISCSIHKKNKKVESLVPNRLFSLAYQGKWVESNERRSEESFEIQSRINRVDRYFWGRQERSSQISDQPIFREEYLPVLKAPGEYLLRRTGKKESFLKGEWLHVHVLKIEKKLNKEGQKALSLTYFYRSKGVTNSPPVPWQITSCAEVLPLTREQISRYMEVMDDTGVVYKFRSDVESLLPP